MPGMSIIVRTVTRIFLPILILFAYYTSVFGHITPGGGFPGGVIFAGACILPILSNGIIKDGKIDHKFIKDFTSKATIIITIAVFFICWGVLFRIPIQKGVPGELFSTIPILLFNIAIGLKIGFKLATAFYELISTNEKPEGGIH